MSQYFSKQHNHLQLKSIPYFKEPHKLSKLQYPHNAIQKLDSFIKKAINLEIVDLSHNSITRPEPLYSLKRLRLLNLSYNQISQITQGICNLSSLKELDLSYNLISKINGLFYVGQLYKNSQGQLHVSLEGNEVMSKFNKAVMDIFNYQNLEKTQQYPLDISLPFYKDSRQIGLQTCKDASKSLETKKKLQCSMLLSKNEDGHHRKNESLLLVLEDSIPKHCDKPKDALFYKQALIELESRFKIFDGIRELKNNKSIGNSYKKICVSSKNCIGILRLMIESCETLLVNTMNSLEEFQEKLEAWVIQINEQEQLIKELHKGILEKLNESEDIPLRFYRAWVHTYRRLRDWHRNIIWFIKHGIKNFERARSIEEITMISPQKKQRVENSEDNESKDKLEGLLFSKKKKDKLLSDSKSKCEDCLIKAQYIKILEEELQTLTHQSATHCSQIETLQQANDQFTKNQTHLAGGLTSKQQTIIDKLQEVTPSDFQSIMLNQAQGIEDLIKTGFHLKNPKEYFIETFRNIPSKERKTQCRTSLPDKQNPQVEKGVSQFVYRSGVTNQSHSAVSKKYLYFNQQNASCKVSRKHTENSIDSTERKSRIKKSHKYQEKSKISKHDPSKIQSKEKKQQLALKGQSCQVTQFMAIESQQISKDQKAQKVDCETNKENINKYTNIGQKYSHIWPEQKYYPTRPQQKYHPVQYTPLELKDKKNYQKYIKHHLRNSILDVLEKKSGKASVERMNCHNKKQISSIYCSVLHKSKPDLKGTKKQEGRSHSRNKSSNSTNRNSKEDLTRKYSLKKERGSPKFIF